MNFEPCFAAVGYLTQVGQIHRSVVCKNRAERQLRFRDQCVKVAMMLWEGNRNSERDTWPQMPVLGNKICFGIGPQCEGRVENKKSIKDYHCQ